jgi:DNA polymerase I-like protein with 3'-5' exonuclease and polymerase domains
LPRGRANSFSAPSVFLRGLIKPPIGTAIAYVDYSSMEFGVAAALSGDPVMLAAYNSGDPYWHFAGLAGAMPPATEYDKDDEFHKSIRKIYKRLCLAMQYGMGVESLAGWLGVSRGPLECDDAEA